MDILGFIGVYRNEVAATHLHYIHSSQEEGNNNLRKLYVQVYNTIYNQRQ